MRTRTFGNLQLLFGIVGLFVFAWSFSLQRGTMEWILSLAVGLSLAVVCPLTWLILNVERAERKSRRKYVQPER